LPRIPGSSGRTFALGENAFRVHWRAGNGAVLTLVANLGEAGVEALVRPSGRLLHATDGMASDGLLPGWSVHWYLERVS